MPDDAARITPVSPPPDLDSMATRAPAPEGGAVADTETSAVVEVTGHDALRAGSSAGRERAGVLVGSGARGGADTAAGASSGAHAPVWTFREPQLPVPEPRSGVDRNQVELPFAVPESTAELPRPQPMFGPVGRSRAALWVPLLAMVTLGAYGLVWHHRTNRELEEFDPKLRVRPGRSTLALAVPWFLGLLTTLAGAALLVTARLAVRVPLGADVTTPQRYWLLAALAAVPYLVLVLPFSAVAVVMTLERIRCVEEHVGRTTDQQVRPVAAALLLAVPLVGGLILLGAEQRRVNAIWDAVAPPGRRHH